MIRLTFTIFSFIAVWLRLLRPGGIRSIAAENIALRSQLIISSRRHKRSPKLTTLDRVLFGLLTPLIGANRLLRIAIVIKPATMLKFHKALIKRKYNLLYSNKKQVLFGSIDPGIIKI